MQNKENADTSTASGGRNKIHKEVSDYLDSEYNWITKTQKEEIMALYASLEEAVGIEHPNLKTVDGFVQEIIVNEENRKAEDVKAIPEEEFCDEGREVFLPVIRKSLVNLLLTVSLGFVEFNLFNTAPWYVHAIFFGMILIAFIATECNILTQEAATEETDEILESTKKYRILKLDIDKFLDGTASVFAKDDEGNVRNLMNNDKTVAVKSFVVKTDVSRPCERYLEINRYFAPVRLQKNGKYLKDCGRIRLAYIYHVAESEILTAETLQ